MERLFDPEDSAEDTVRLNGEEVHYRSTYWRPDDEDVDPGQGEEEVLLRWPDGSAFRMRFYLSPEAWRDSRASGAAAFFGAVHKLISEGFEENDGFVRPPFSFWVEESAGVRIVSSGYEQPATTQTVLRVLAELMDKGMLDQR